MAAVSNQPRPGLGEDVVWMPTAEMLEHSSMRGFIDWVGSRHGRELGGYEELWRWSVDDPEGFWRSIWDFFEVSASAEPGSMSDGGPMPGTRWFGGARLNYAEHALRARSTTPAIVAVAEGQPVREIGWEEMRREVARVASALAALGVGSDSRVVAYLPNGPEAVIGFLACASLGAIWSSCSPEYGVDGALSRFSQLRPTVLLAVSAYRFSGRDRSRAAEVGEIVAGLEALRAVIHVPSSAASPLLERAGVPVLAWEEVGALDADLGFAQVPADHPLWVLFSSGTTGPPKGIVHGHGGILLEHLKVHGLHNDLGPDDRFLFVGSTSWMVWNILVSGLLVGATIVLVDGNVAHPHVGRLWEIVAEQAVTFLGVGAAYLKACADLDPATLAAHDLSSLRCVHSTGSPLAPEAADWVRAAVREDVWLVSSSGGTDICTALVTGCPILPARRGRIQARALGVKAEAFDEGGKAVVGARGELVVTEPMPSMPLSFWDDGSGERYRSAYFSTFPGIWRHGDFIEFDADGSSVILGRSDSTLNRRGIRMGSAEIYAVVESLPGVLEALVVGVDLDSGGYFMPLFVVAKEDADFDELEGRIRRSISRRLSPRHVPDQIVPIPSIPKTRTGKKLELPVKRVLAGEAPSEVVDLASLEDADALRWLAEWSSSLGLGDDARAAETTTDEE